MSKYQVSLAFAKWNRECHQYMVQIIYAKLIVPLLGF